MFNRDFYPTPDWLIRQMLEGTDLSGQVVLEPSAGKGNIIDYINDNKNDVGVPKNILACEFNPELKKIVQTKAEFLNDNWLKVQAEHISHVDVIIMNPPFGADADIAHIEHAKEICPPGCLIIALCNTTRFDNTTLNRKRFFTQFDEHRVGLFEWEDAERSAVVNITMIKYQDPRPKEDLEFQGFFEMEDSDVSDGTEGVMSYNAIREIVQRYVGACKLYHQVMDLGVQMGDLIAPFPTSSDLVFTMSQGGKQSSYEQFKKSLQKAAWKYVFNALNMEKFMTKSLMAEINKFVEQQEKVPFTMKNIYTLIDMVIQTHNERMGKVLLEVFDKLTKHYHDNRYNVEGWKTNDSYLIGEKFILPYIVTPDTYGGMGDIRVKYDSNAEIVEDFCKAISWLEGVDWNPHQNSLYQVMNNHYLTKEEILQLPGKKESYLKKLERYRREYPDHPNTKKWEGNEDGWIEKEAQYDEENKKHSKYMSSNTWYDWGFFQIKGFKKGTMHFKFKDRDVWARVNRKICELRGFGLPEIIKIKKKKAA